MNRDAYDRMMRLQADARRLDAAHGAGKHAPNYREPLCRACRVCRALQALGGAPSDLPLTAAERAALQLLRALPEPLPMDEVRR